MMYQHTQDRSTLAIAADGLSLVKSGIVPGDDVGCSEHLSRKGQRQCGEE